MAVPLAPDSITLLSKVHGMIRVSPIGFDLLMARYLPASPAQLKQQLRERSGTDDYDDLATVAECLMVLAEYDGMVM